MYRSFWKACGAAALWGGIALCALPAQAQSRFVRCAGTSLTWGGAKWTPRGVNLGNWFVLKPYMVGGGSSTEQVRTAFVALAGGMDSYQKWRAAYLTAYTTRKDILRLKGLGFNTVRVPLDWRDFVDANGGRVPTGQYGTALPPHAPLGLAVMDRLLTWCAGAGVYVLPDMHVTPGTAGGDSSSIYVASDTETNTGLEQVKAAWATFAHRYRDVPALLGYDLLNEPPGSLNSRYRPTYQQIARAIRQQDTNHLLVLESNVYADLGDTVHGDGFLGKPIDTNMAVSIHSYGGDLLPPASLDADYATQTNGDDRRAYYAFAYADKENVPVVVGETGENNNDWVNAIVHLWTVGKVGVRGQAITAGVVFWDYKKPGDAVRAVVSVPFPAGWDAAKKYLSSPAALPPDGLDLLMRLAASSSYASETVHQDVVDALRRDYHASLPLPYPAAVPTIPGRVSAAEYDMGVAAPTAAPGDDSHAYFSANLQTKTYQVRNDRVGTYTENGSTAVGFSAAGDWQGYTVRAVPGTYQVFLEYGAPVSGARLDLSLDGKPLLSTPALLATGGWRVFREVPVGTAVVRARGQATLRITVAQAGLDYVQVRFARLLDKGAPHLLK